MGEGGAGLLSLKKSLHPGKICCWYSRCWWSFPDRTGKISLSLSISPVTKKSFQILLGIIIYFMLNKWFFLVINKNVLICVAAVSLLLSVVPSLKRNRIGNPVAPLSQDRLIGKQKFLNQRQFWFVSPQSVCSWPLMEIHLSRETELETIGYCRILSWKQ